MAFTNTPNMGLPVPVVYGPNGEPGPQYATDVNQALSQLDSHNHSAGQGVPIGAQGINLTSDLSFNLSNAINLRTARFIATTATSGTDVGCLYVRGVDLFYNDVNANVVRITNNGGLASTSQFFGQISTTAIISATGGTPATSGFIRMNNNTDFVSWRNAANTGDDKIYFDNTDTLQIIGGGGINANSIKIKDPGGNTITMLAPVAFSPSYSLQLPPALPSTASLVQMSSTGGLFLSNSITSPVQFGASSACATFSINPALTTLILGGTCSGIQFGSSAFAGINTTGDSKTLTVESSAGNQRAILTSNTAAAQTTIWGTVNSDGTKGIGEGFSSSKTGTGTYNVVLTPAVLSSVGIILPALQSAAAGSVSVSVNDTTTFTVVTFNSSGVAADRGFNFLVIGAR